MEQRITATELARRLSDFLSRVQFRGERFLVERNGTPVASLAPPAAATTGVSLGEVAERLTGLSWPDDDFADDLAAIQAEQTPPASPWAN